MRTAAFCLLLLCLVAAILAAPGHEDREKRSPHHSKIKVKIIERGPLGLRKHKYRFKGYGIGHGLGLGSYASGYGYGGLGGGWGGGWGGAGASSYSSSFSSPFGSFASASAHAVGKR